MSHVNFTVFDTVGGLRELPSSGCLGVLSASINPEAKANIEAFNSFIRRVDQPSFFISEKQWEMLRNGENHRERWLPEGYEVYGFVFCLALKRQVRPGKEGNEKEDRKYFGYAYFRIRTILKKTALSLAGITEFDAYVEKKCIAYADVVEALSDNSETNSAQIKFLTSDPADDAMRDLVNSEVIQKGDDANLIHTFFQGVDTSIDEGSKERKILGVFSNEGGIFGKERVEEIRKEKGSRISIARRIRPFDKERDQEEGMPDLLRRETYYHFKINPEYETVVPCPMPRICSGGS